MRPLSQLAAHDVARLSGIAFDLDGTLLSGGALTLSAYRALHALGEAGLSLVACTGRPAAWGEALQRQWPLAATVVENGALAYAGKDGAVERLDRIDAASRGRRRARLLTVIEQLRAQFPDVPFAGDNLGRLSDVTFDIGERHTVPADRIAALREAAAELGARTFVSSIHLHVTLDTDDKASGTLRVLSSALGEDASAALWRWGFIGDSANDEACFGAFHLTFGVCNVRPHLAQLSVAPRFVSSLESGEGFAEIAERLVALKAGG